MRITRPALIAFLAGAALLSACTAGRDAEPKVEAEAAPASPISGVVDTAIGEARKEIREGNISLDSEDRQAPKGEITPAGDLLIDGKAVAIDASQRALLLEHRANIVVIAEAGVDIGLQGADLAAIAVTESVKGVFNGESEQAEKRVEAEADKIRASAVALCERMPAVIASQQRLAAALPEFAPYATMTADDLDDCRDGSRK